MRFDLVMPGSRAATSHLPERAGAARSARLTERDAVDIWIARWLRVRRKDIVARYGCDPRRIYEIWEGAKFPGARRKAQDRFLAEHPSLADRVDFGPHRRIPRFPDRDAQFDLFPES